MPEFKLPTKAEGWAAVETNETDQLLHDAMSIDAGALQLAAASRLLERERCVAALAKWFGTKGGFDDDDMSAARDLSEARRILEDR